VGLRHKLGTGNPVAAYPTIRKRKTLPRPFSDGQTEWLLAVELPPTERVARDPPRDRLQATPSAAAGCGT
jgi:hypothetical protein